MENVMTEAKTAADFTEGPWEIDRSLKYYQPCIRHNGWITALLPDNSGGMVYPQDARATDAANAQLIATAPDLYEALADAVRWLEAMDRNGVEYMPNNCMSRAMMREVLERAK